MSQAAMTPEEDISEQLKAIVIEAGNRVDASPAPRSGVRTPSPPASENPSRPPAEAPIPSWLRPVLQGLEALSDAHSENALRLHRIEKALAANEGVPQLLGESRNALEQRNVVNRVMFEALHTELKGYKDAFMLDSVMKPVIRDLITLYDDMWEIHRQVLASLSAQQARGEVTGAGVVLLENVQTMGSNIEHNVHFILEVLERMEVTLLPENTGKLDKRTQRAVAVEVADTQDQENSVVKIVKRGFVCRDRIVRPEEVVIKKWKEGCLVALTPSVPQPEQHK